MTRTNHFHVVFHSSIQKECNDIERLEHVEQFSLVSEKKCGYDLRRVYK